MSEALRLSSGEACKATSIVGEILHVISPVPFAPGAPVDFSIDDLTLHAKSRGSRRRQDGAFDVQLRLVNLRREERDKLRDLFLKQERSH